MVSITRRKYLLTLFHTTFRKNGYFEIRFKFNVVVIFLFFM